MSCMAELSDAHHRTAVDRWIAVVFWGAVVLCAAGGVYGILTRNVAGICAGWFGVVFALGAVRIVAWPIVYRLGRSDIGIRMGVMTQRIAYKDILTITPSRNWQSGPAWSLNRLRVTFRYDHGGTGELLISPQNHAAFLQDFVARSVIHQQEGASVVRHQY